MTDTSSQPPPAVRAPSRFRRRSLAAYRVVGIITLAAIAVQFTFAGLGAFGASFDAHRTLGDAIAVLTILMLVTVLLVRPDWQTVALTGLLVVLAVAVQNALASLGDDTDAWFGGLHALNGVLIGVLTARLASFGQGFTSTERNEVEA